MSTVNLKNTMKTGIEQINEERTKQIDKYGYSPSHDSNYKNKELLFAALAYINTAIYGSGSGSEDWPFEIKFFHDDGYVENLKKAGALIAAELDRLNIN